MESVNIINTNLNNRPLIGWIPPKVNAGTASLGFMGITNPIGAVFYPISGGIIISAASYVPQMVGIANQNWVNNQPKVIEFTTWQRNLNIYTANDFVGDFSLKYQIIDYQRVYDFLFENEFLTPLISQAVGRIEDYFQGFIKNLYLMVQEDPENEGAFSTLILQVEFSGSIQNAYQLLTKFQTEWFIPIFGPKILQFCVDLV